MKLKILPGDLFVLMATLLWSWAPFVMQYLSQSFNPLFMVGLSNIIAALFLAIVLGIKKQLWTKKYLLVWKDIVLTVFFIAILAYALLFLAAKHTAPNTLSILNLSQILWAFFILGILRFESFSKSGIAGAVLMLLGSYFVISNDALQFHWANILVIGANALFVIGNIFQRRARQKINSKQLIFIRSLLAGVLLLGFSLVQSPSVFTTFTLNHWYVFLFLGIGIFAIEKIFWVEGIHRNPITRCNIVAALAPGLTMLWSILIWDINPSTAQWIGFSLMLLGSWAIIIKKDAFLVLRK